MSLRILSLPGRELGVNPYTKLFCDALENAGMRIANIHNRSDRYFRFEVIHLHFPDFYVTTRPFHKAIVLAPSMIGYMIAIKILGKKIVWTVHDVTPTRPRHPRLLRLYLFCVRSLVDAYVFMNPSSYDEFTKKFPQTKKKPSRQVPHGPYPVCASPPQRPAEARDQLSGGADCLLIGFFGDIKPHKNPDALAYLPRVDSVGREVKIVVAGASDPDDDPVEVEDPLDRIPPGQLVRISERLTERRLTEIIRAVDVVFLPYLRGSNSGMAMLVLSQRQRLLCSALPMFRDLRECLGPPWVYIFDHQANDLSAELRAALSRFQHDAVDTQAESRLSAFLDDRSFDRGAQQLRALYERLLYRGPPNR